MRFSCKYAGKWVATKREKIVASDDHLDQLMQKIEKKKNVGIDYVPVGFLAGSIYTMRPF